MDSVLDLSNYADFLSAHLRDEEQGLTEVEVQAGRYDIRISSHEGRPVTVEDYEVEPMVVKEVPEARGYMNPVRLFCNTHRRFHNEGEPCPMCPVAAENPKP